MTSKQDAAEADVVDENRMPPPLVLTEGVRNMMEDLQWAASAPEVLQHPGQFVVVHKKRVLAAGMDRASLVAQASKEEHCPWWELAVYVVPPDEPFEIPR